MVLRQLEYELCRKDPWYWLTHWVFTLDEHDRNVPIKQYPSQEYLKKALVDPWLKYDKLIVAKSRQMIATWTFVALYLHNTQFNVGRLNFFTSKKEEDADALVGRAEFIYGQQPKFLRPYKMTRSFCKMEFPEIHSKIKGVPQGGDQLRMHTASGVFSDEMAFQTEAEDSYTAAKPTIEGGGRFTAVSSAFPSFFQELFEDNTGVYVDEEWEQKNQPSTK